MTHQKNDTQDENESQASFEAMLREQLQQAVRTALISVLEVEVDAFIGAVRYEQSEQRGDYRNGHYRRGLDTSLGHISDLPVPRTCKLRLSSRHGPGLKYGIEHRSTPFPEARALQIEQSSR